MLFSEESKPPVILCGTSVSCGLFNYTQKESGGCPFNHALRSPTLTEHCPLYKTHICDVCSLTLPTHRDEAVVKSREMAEHNINSMSIP